MKKKALLNPENKKKCSIKTIRHAKRISKNKKTTVNLYLHPTKHTLMDRVRNIAFDHDETNKESQETFKPWFPLSILAKIKGGFDVYIDNEYLRISYITDTTKYLFSNPSKQSVWLEYNPLDMIRLYLSKPFINKGDAIESNHQQWGNLPYYTVIEVNKPPVSTFQPNEKINTNINHPKELSLSNKNINYFEVNVISVSDQNIVLLADVKTGKHIYIQNPCMRSKIVWTFNLLEVTGSTYLELLDNSLKASMYTNPFINSLYYWYFQPILPNYVTFTGYIDNHDQTNQYIKIVDRVSCHYFTGLYSKGEGSLTQLADLMQFITIDQTKVQLLDKLYIDSLHRSAFTRGKRNNVSSFPITLSQ